jgi:EAL domain-containing protein (putative c-di-GMP-specific phosphodiesterase class I)/ActR/RegA family two-component response regulator
LVVAVPHARHRQEGFLRPKIKKAPMPARNLSFLIVEDHEFQRKTMVQLLTTMGAKAVHSAQDGVEALKVIRDPDCTVDIVVSDLAMPGMDGMELIRNLSETGDRVSLIIASALDQDLLESIAHMAHAYKVKLLGVIGKPPTASKLAPLLELHRTSKAEPIHPDTFFSLGEIAQAWTHNEFEPLFEPKIDLATGAVKGVHASPCWRHPVQGTLRPALFMPSVQARGLNDDFVWMMLHKCMVQQRQWQLKGLDLPISVNLPLQSLDDLRLTSRIKQLAANEGTAPASLILGVREAELKTDQAKVLENLARLRMAGFGLAIDEFGDGLMAFEQLSLVAFTELKIGKSFVTDISFDESVRAGLAVALEMARQLKVTTVADGIESKDEWTLLHEWGCDYGQGPFISEPMSGSALPRWIAGWSGSAIQ